MKKTKIGYKENISRILAIFFCVFPWITYVKILEYNDAEQNIFSSYEGLALDFFLYYKERILILMSIFLVCWFLGERIFPDKVDNNVPLLKGKNKWLFILMGVFLGCAFVSTVFSKYHKWNLCCRSYVLCDCVKFDSGIVCGSSRVCASSKCILSETHHGKMSR